jgi:methionyl-tRNA formyltransferase
LGGERIKLLRSHLAAGTGAPGTVLGGLTVACGTGAVTVTEVQRAGRRPMVAAEFLRGTDLAPGTRLGPG